MKCTQLVVQDHVILRRGLDILDGMVQRLEDGQRIEIADVVAVLKFLRLFGDGYHQTAEENVLFPLLLPAAPPESPLHQMLSEHSEERSLVTAIENALKFKMGTDFVRCSRQFIVLLRNHLEKEDAVLRPMADGTLSPEQDNFIVVELMKNYVQPESCANFPRLERKYTSKAHTTPLSPVREVSRARAGSVQ